MNYINYNNFDSDFVEDDLEVIELLQIGIRKRIFLAMNYSPLLSLALTLTCSTIPLLSKRLMKPTTVFLFINDNFIIVFIIVFI